MAKFKRNMTPKEVKRIDYWTGLNPNGKIVNRLLRKHRAEVLVMLTLMDVTKCKASTAARIAFEGK